MQRRYCLALDLVDDPGADRGIRTLAPGCLAGDHCQHQNSGY
jgi:hypothetical protein